MAKLQYKSYDDINADPDKLLEFARTLKAEFEASSNHLVMGFSSFAQRDVSVGGKPLSMSRQMVHLEMQDNNLEDMKPGDLTALHKAGTILRELEPTWDISRYQNDARVGVKLQEMKEMAPVDGLASRMSSMLVQKPPAQEHTVRTGLMPR